jgi:hypothetical protein
VSQANVEIVRRGYAHRQAQGDFLAEVLAPDYVWDMSHFRGWPYSDPDEALKAVGLGE